MVVNEGDGTATFTVTRSGDTTGVSSVFAITSDGTALQPGDYTSVVTQVNFAANQTTAQVNVPIIDDAVFETPEQFLVNLVAPVNATIIDASGVGTILDDDNAAVQTFVGINDVVVDESAGVATFIVTRSGDLNVTSSVDYVTADNSATAGADYTATNGTLNFAVGQAFLTIDVPITEDLLDELDENFLVNLSNPTNVVISDNQGVGVIIDNDNTGAPATRFFIDDVVVNESAGFATFTVTRVGDTSGASSVDYSLSDGSATSPADYINLPAATLNFAAGITTQTIMVPIVDDAVPEFLEQFQVNLSNAVNGSISDHTGEGFIIDNDAPFKTEIVWGIDDVTVNESDGTATFTVTRAGTITQAASIDFQTADASATQPADYGFSNGTLNFAANVASQTITVPIVDDGIFEGAERFIVNLSNNSNGTIVDGTGIGTILDNDRPVVTIEPLLTINDVIVDESAGTATFTVFRVGDLTQASSVDFVTNDGTAADPADYLTTNGTVNFAAGVGAQTITVNITDDAVFENTEFFTVDLSGAVNGVIADNQGVGVILDDDAAALPRLYISDAVANESDGTISFTVTRVGTAAQLNQVSTADLTTADGSALAGPDYTAAPNPAAVVFAAFETVKIVTVPLIDDAVPEPLESFLLNLSNVTGATVGDPTGTGYILDDDVQTPQTQLAIDDVTVNESDGVATFTVTRAGDVSAASSVFAFTADGSAVTGADYTATVLLVSFAAGETTQTVNVPITDDAVFENPEQFTVNLAGAVGATVVDATGVGTILDDDQATGPFFSINDVIVSEDAGTATFTVLRVGDVSQASSVDFTTADGTALQPGDYISNFGTLNFAAGENSMTVDITITDDAIFENPEQFVVNLTTPVNGVIADTQGVGTIIDNDIPNALPGIIVSDAVANEADGMITFTLTRTGDLSAASTVDVNTLDGSASSPADFTSVNPPVSVNFGVGIDTVTVDVPIVDDAIDEPLEQFQLVLSNPTNAQIIDPTGTGWIIDNDPPAGARSQLAINDVTVFESDGTATFTVTRSGDIDDPASVSFVTVSGTANDGSDYLFNFGTVNFAANQAQTTIDITILDDAIFETPEEFTINLFNASPGTTIIDQTGVGTIIDDDSRDLDLCWMISGDNRVVEGNDAEYTVQYIGDVIPQGDTSFIDISLDFSPGPIPAENADFSESLLDSINDSLVAGVTAVIVAPNTVRLTFEGGGPTSFTFDIDVLNDAIPEGEEVYAMVLRNPEDGKIEPTQGAVATIIDDVAAQLPTVAVSDGVPNPALEGTDPTITFTITLSQPATENVQVTFNTMDGTATGGADYVAIGIANVTFLPGQISQDVQVTVLDDAILENLENFTLELSSAVFDPGGANTPLVITDDSGLGNIQDNERDLLPDADDDIDMVRLGGNDTTGNVITGVDTDVDPVNQGMLDDDVEGNAPAIIREISHDGAIYTLNVAADDVTAAGAPHGPFSYNDATGELTFTTMLGGEITISLDGATPGFYTYTSPANAAGDILDFTVNADPGFGGAASFTFPNGIEVTAVDQDPGDGNNPQLVFFNSGGAVGIGGISNENGTNKFFDNEALDVTLPDPAFDITLSLADMPAADGRQVRVTVEGTDVNGAPVTAVLAIQGVGAGQEANDYVLNQADYIRVGGGPIAGPISINSFTIDSWQGNDPELGFNSNESSFVVHGITTGLVPMEMLTYTIEDTDGDQSSADLIFKLKPEADGVPTAKDDKFFVDESGAGTTDVVIVFDHSGSMGDDPNVPGFANRFDLARDAVAQLVNSPGIQNVMVVGFDDDATHSNWGTPAQALAVIDTFLVGQTTNYAAAIEEVMNNFDTGANPRPPAADTTNIYFLSDGVPVPSSADLSSNGLVGPWENFLAANNVDMAFAVGIGSGVSGGDADLEEIAWPNGDPGNPVILLDESELASTLVGTLPTVLEGNILEDNGNGADMFGPDGMGQILSIEIDGVTYSYDVGADTITPSAGPVIAGSTLTVMTALGGDLTFEFADGPGGIDKGDFEYASPTVDMDEDESFTYTIADANGDLSTANFDICIKDDPPDLAGKLLINEIGLGVGTPPGSPPPVMTPGTGTGTGKGTGKGTGTGTG